MPPSRRDALLADLAARLRRPGRGLRRAGAVVLGWLVLMTIWGFGRSWHDGLAPVELAVGLVCGGVVTLLAWRRSGG